MQYGFCFAGQVFQARFPLGLICYTPQLAFTVTEDDIAKALSRHAQCDWGDVVEEDRKENEFSLDKGLRLFSVYHDRKGVKFWIITEADRTVTTVLLPEEY